MSSASKKSRQKLVNAALELFLSQGIANTATRQIANLASVNEATLFRNFGNKYGLLESVIQETELFSTLEEKIKLHLHPGGGAASQSLKDYALAFLEAVEQQQALLCSLIGEAENYSDSFKATLTQTLMAANVRLTPLIQEDLPPGRLTPETFMALFHGLLLSYTILRFSGQIPVPWSTPENYVDAVLRLLSATEVDLPSSPQGEDSVEVQDLPRTTVHALLQQAKKQGARDYAIAYLLFSTGVTPTEICGLKKSDRRMDSQQHLLTICGQGSSRQVPINQWILGKRYGSYTSNPLTRWLKSRKDEANFLFVTDVGLALTPNDIEQSWQQVCAGIDAQYQLWQCTQTWRVEMLMRGVTVDNLSILTGVSVEQLAPLAQRAREKAALEQAIELDKKM